MKILRRIALCLCLVFSASILWACGKEDAKITEIYFKEGSVVVEVEQFSNFSTKDIIVIAKYDDGTEKEVSDVTFEGISTDTIGEKTLKATYKGFTCEIIITVVEAPFARNYYVAGIQEPEFVVELTANKKVNTYTDQLQNTGNKGFVDISRLHKVGNDNPFKFSPVLKIEEFDSVDDYDEIDSGYPIAADVYMKEAEGSTYQLLTTNLATFVSIDADAHEFQFTDAAEGKFFKIAVRPDFEIIPGDDGDYEQAIDNQNNRFKSVEFEFKVVDGYNVYNAADLSIVDNSNDENKWAGLKSAEMIAKSRTTKAAILQGNIVIEKEDIPSIHFYSANDPEFGSIAGKMDNEDHYVARGVVYKRVIADKDSFKMEGNYFTISLDEDFPLITVPMESLGQEEVLTPSTTLFAFIDDYTEYRDFVEANQNSVEKGIVDSEEETCEINNVSFMGNNNKNEKTARNEAGMTCYKTENVNFTIDNCLSQAWYIAHYLEGSSYSGDNVTHTLKNCTSFDSYNTLMYIEGARNVVIENSWLIGAGGPVMICDEAIADIDYNNDDDTDDEGEIFKFKTNVLVKNSKLESWVVGTEAWFDQMHARDLAAQIKQMDQIIREPFSMDPNVEKKGIGLTILDDDTKSKMNIVAVYKSTTVTNPTKYCQIDGSFNVEGFNYGLDFSYAELQLLPKNQHALQTFSGALLSADGETVTVPIGSTKPADFVTRINEADKYIATYLFNGMGAVFGAAKP